MKEKNELHFLEQIERVEAPPFLFTRIEAKIAAKAAEQLPINWLVAASFGLIAIVAFNIFSITYKVNEKSNRDREIEAIVESTNLFISNQLYDE